jgi:hypothetical protein
MPRLALLLATAALGAAALLGTSSSATGGATSCAGPSGTGYTYAGHQATYRGHGVRATITPQRIPQVSAGHVAAWVGVGGPGQGPNGEDVWLQAGIASIPGLGLMTYVEIARPGEQPQFELVEHGLVAGQPQRVAVLEMGGRPGWWRAWVGGQPMTEPIHLPGSSGRWEPIATAESWNGGQDGCNRFAFQFERVSVSYGGGGSWRPFVSGYRFLDGRNELRALATAPAGRGVYARTLASRSVLPYAFVASAS